MNFALVETLLQQGQNFYDKKLTAEFFRRFVYNSYAEKRQPSLVVAMNQHIFENIFLKLISFAIVLSKYIYMRPKTEMSWSSSSDGRLGNSCEREILTEWQSPSVIASFK